MSWTYLFFIPVIASFIWPIALIVRKEHTTSAQWLFCVLQVVTGFAIVAYMGEIASRFVYNYIFVNLSILAVPTFYQFICVVTSSGGRLQQKDRLAFAPAVAYLIFFNTLAIFLGPERYQMFMDNVMLHDDLSLRPSKAYSLMIFLNYYGFSFFMMIQILLIFLTSAVKLHRYHLRIAKDQNDVYGEVRRLDRPIMLFVYLSIPITIFLNFMPHTKLFDSPVWIACIAVVMSVAQFTIGYYGYHLNYVSARFLPEEKKTVSSDL